jgi:hypothetical protein
MISKWETVILLFTQSSHLYLQVNHCNTSEASPPEGDEGIPSQHKILGNPCTLINIPKIEYPWLVFMNIHPPICIENQGNKINQRL